MGRLIRALAIRRLCLFAVPLSCCCFWTAVSSAQSSGPAAQDDAVNLVIKLNDPSGKEDDPPLGAGIVVGLGPGRAYAVTAYHVLVRPGGEVIKDLAVEFKFRPREPVKARLLQQFSPALDLAVIVIPDLEPQGIPAEQWRFKRLGDSNALKSGDAVFPIGHPQGKLWIRSIEPGRFSRNVGNSLFFDWASVVPGNSGGALVNEVGELVGMVRSDQQTASEALRMEAVLEMVRDRGFPVSLERPSKVNISGFWRNDQVDTKIPIRMEFESDGTVVFGTVRAWAPSGENRGVGIQDGKTDGKIISFSVQEKYESKPYSVDLRSGQRTLPEYSFAASTYRGEVVSPDQIRFVYQSRQGMERFTVRREVDLYERYCRGECRTRAGEYRRLYTLAGHTGGVNSLHFDSAEMLLSGGREDGQVKFWHLSDAKLRWNRFTGPDQTPGIVTVSRRYVFQMPQSAAGQLHLDNWRLGPLDTSLSEPQSVQPILHGDLFGVDNDSGNVAFLDDGFINFWYSGTIRRPVPKVRIPATLKTLAYTKDEDLVASVEASGATGAHIVCRRVTIANEEARLQILWQTPVDHAAQTLKFVPSPEGAGALIVADAKTGVLRVLNTKSGETVLTLSPQLGLGKPAFAFDGKATVLAYATDSSNLVRFWDFRSGKLRLTLDAGGPVCALALSGDRRLLASGDCKSGEIHLWARPPESRNTP